jgi:myxalamid-type polyketide synthase MxaB
MDQGLVAFSAGEEMPDVLSQPLPPSSSQPKVAFLFTGQGSQYVSMGYQLYQTQPTFRNILDRCDELLRPYLKQPLLAVLYPEAGAASLLDETAYTQPALFALEYALARLWQSWGIEPAVVMGHSVGEYVAACVAGVFSLADGLTLIAKRGQLMQDLMPAGEMAVVLAGESQVATAVAPYAETVSIAAINGPENTVISGDRESIQKILGQLESVGIRAHRLTVSHAFHSPLMESMLDPFEQTAAKIAYAPARLKLISNLTGQLVEDGLMAEASYWRRHVRETVRFSTAMETLSEQGCEIFMEIGPNPILLGMGRRCVPEGAGIWLPSLRESSPDWQQMLRSLARLYVHGVKVDWVGFEQDYPRQRVELPTYPFQRQRYWLEPATRRSKKSSGVAPNKMQSAASHPLLGQRLDSPLREIQFQARLSPDSLPFLPDHRVHDIVTLPATAFLEMVQAAAIEALGSAQSTIIIEDFVVQQALLFCEDHDQTVQFILTPQDVASANFQIFSFFEADVQDKEPSWTLLAAGKVRLEPADTVRIQVSLEAIQAQCPEPVPLDLFYQRKRERGLNHGQSFQGIEQLWRKDGAAVGQIRLPEPVFEQSESYQIHPALLDTCLQVSEAAFPGFGRQEAEADLYLPVVWERVKIYGRARSCGNLIVEPCLRTAPG